MWVDVDVKGTEGKSKAIVFLIAFISLITYLIRKSAEIYERRDSIGVLRKILLRTENYKKALHVGNERTHAI